MKKVYVHAFLAGNVGDDLFVRTLCRRYPGVLFRTFADRSYKDVFADLPNMQVFSPGDPEIGEMTEKLKKRKWLYGTDDFLMYLFKRSDAIVHIGGSVFVQHKEDWSEAFEMDKKLADNAKRLFVIGANFGPYTDPEYLNAYRNLFKKYKGICFRDHYSADLFKDYKQVAYAPDVLFAAPIKAAVPKKKMAVICPIELSNRGGKNSILEYEEAYRHYHIMIVKELIRQGYEISFLSFCRMQSDDTMTSKICEGLTPEEKAAVKTQTFDGHEEPILKEFEEAELVIGTRFHSIIMGLVGKCKTLGIIYDHKTRNVLEDLAFDRKLELSELEAQTEETVKEAVKELMGSEPVDVSDMTRGADRMFAYLDKVLPR